MITLILVDHFINDHHIQEGSGFSQAAAHYQHMAPRQTAALQSVSQLHYTIVQEQSS